MMMCIEIPARNPVVTGNREQGGQPAGAEQADGDEDDADHEGKQRGQLAIGIGPATAIAASAPAKIGAMVESAWTDMNRLAPKAAKASDPAAKA